MASLPPGWTADYDGQRWFFTYGPTGQSQFQFPRPGDEFPDSFCCGAGGFTTVLPEAKLSPEERLESERQVRRQLLLNAAGSSGGPGGSGTGEVVVDDEDGSLLVPRLSPMREPGRDEEVGAVCFGNFAAVRSLGARGLGGGCEEGARIVGQSDHCDGDRVGMPKTTGVVDVFRESSGELVFASPVIKGEHAQAASSPHRGSGSTAAISIMSEPVMAVAEIKAAIPSMGHRGGSEHQVAPLAQPSPPELPTPGEQAIESAHTPPWVLSVGVIPELYSESTALCEEEINPPPVELPGDERGWNGQAIVPDMPVQGPAELPAYEAAPGVDRGKGSSIAQLEQKCLTSDYAATSKFEQGEAPRAERRGHDRAGLPSQASRKSSEKSLDKTSPSERLNSAPDQKLLSRDTDQPAEKARSIPRDLTHFPSILRPGPRRSSDQHRPLPPTVIPASVTSTSSVAARAQAQQHEQQVEAYPVRHQHSTRMPTEPPLPTHAREPQRVAPTAGPEAPRPHGGGARRDRLPSSVNFVIPIRHMSRDELHYDAPGDAAAGTGGGSPEYEVKASFASPAMSPEKKKSDPAAGNQAGGGGSPGFVSGRKTESWGWRAGEAGPVQLVGGRSAAGRGPEWSWGWAR